MSVVSWDGRAFDMANYSKVPTSSQLDCFDDLGYTLGIVGASFERYWNGDDWIYGWPKKQLTALQLHDTRRHAYSWLRHPFAPNRYLMETAFEQIAGTGVEMMWIDVEDGPSAETVSVQQRVEDVWQAIDYWKNARPDLALGIYTGDWWWDAYMPGVNETFGLPLWLAAYVLHEEDLDNSHGISEGLLKTFIPGGWTPKDVWLWQYMGSIETCGLNIDRNVILTTEVGRVKYTDEVLDKAFTAILKDLGFKGEQIVALGTGLGSVAQSLYTHIYNNGDFTQPQLIVLDELKARIDSNTTQIADLVAKIKAAGEAFNA